MRWDLKITFAIAVLLSSIAMLPTTVSAQAPGQNNQDEWGNLEVPIGGIDSISAFINQNRNTPLVRYMAIVLRIVTGVIVVIGVISVVIGGYLYMTAGGDAGRVERGKEWIMAALLGIVLALAAYTILNTISPQFIPQQDPRLNSTNDDNSLS